MHAGEPPGRTCHACGHHNLHSLGVRSNPLASLQPYADAGKVRFQKTWEEVDREQRSEEDRLPGLVMQT